MRINTAAYAKLFNLGNYENERIELGAELEEGEDWAQSVEDLKNKVDLLGFSYAEDRGADKEASYKEYGARARLERINADIDAAQARWEKALAFLKAQGVETSALGYSDDIPF